MCAAEPRTLSLYVDGEHRPPSGGAYFDNHYPYTGEVESRVPRGNAQDVNAAVAAADRACREGPWARMTAIQRGKILYAIGDIIAAHAKELATLEVRDNGKLMGEMLGQMTYLPEWFYYYGGLADKIEGSVTPAEREGMFHYITHKPQGVVAAIAPWNSPLLLVAWKLAPALAAGNTIVAKPSEFSPSSMLRLAELMVEAGLPKGVVNVVTGFGDEVGAPLTHHPDVARIAFTGGEGGGRAVYKAAAENFKRVSLELGGKSPNIVFDDADLDDAARGTVAGIWTQDLGRAMTLPKRIRAGSVWVNAYRVVSYMAPFGGFKASGIGRENGKEAIMEYLETKSVFINAKRGMASPFVMSTPGDD